MWQLRDRDPINVTELLHRWGEGDPQALHTLVLVAEQELRRIARRLMRHEREDHTLQATALVNDAYLRLLRQENIDWRDRAHFFGIAAHIMRQILIDHARKVGRKKRSGGRNVPLDEALVFTPERSAALMALDEALERLNRLDNRKARVVELRYFGGLSVQETAEVLKVHENTVIRDWALAKAWLRKEMGEA